MKIPTGEPQTCPHCEKVVGSPEALETHITSIHVKTPCDQCGKLVVTLRMARHIITAHTPNDQLKHKCDICFKGEVFSLGAFEIILCSHC